MKTGTAVLTTLPVLYLHQAGLLDVLPVLYRHIMLPEAVRAELLDRQGRGIPTPPIAQIEWLTPIAPPQINTNGLLPQWTPANAEALHIAIKHPGSLLIIEGKFFHQSARDQGARASGTLGLLLYAHSRALIGPPSEWIDPLRKAGMFITRKAERTARMLSGNAKS